MPQATETKGVTLIELLIVVLILAALAAVAIPRISRCATAARQNACDTNVDTINAAIEAYYVDHGTYPAELKDVTKDITCFPDGPPLCPFGGKYRMHDTKRVTCNHKSLAAAEPVPPPPPAPL